MTTIKTLTDREHVLLRPGMYVGDIHARCHNKSVLREGRIIDDYIVYVPALEKIFREVLDNALDNVERTRRKGGNPGKISVIVRDDTVMVRNEGNPFAIEEEDEEGLYPAERALGMLRSGSNFDSGRGQVAGLNGVGSTCTNYLSLLFDADLCNGQEKKRLRLRWTNNGILASKTLEDYEGPSYTKITYIADFARFYDSDTEFGVAGERRYSSDMINAFAKHCIDGALTAGVPVSFNKTIYTVPDIKAYASFLYPDLERMNVLELETEDTKCLLIDTTTQCRTTTFVNGISVKDGVHVEVWQKRIVEPLMPAFKKIKLPLTARNAYKHVFKCVSMIMMCRYDNIEFSEQVKDKLTSPKPEVPVLDTKCMVKWESIKLMAKRMLALASSMENVTKKNDGKKSAMCGIDKLSDADRAGSTQSQECTLYVCEGDSASALAEKYIDGMWNGVLPVQGKPLNVSKCKKEDYEANEEIKALNKALGLKEGLDYSDDTNFATLRYGKLVSLTDQDVDGAGHIVGLLMNFLRKRHPTLLERNPSFFNVFETPLMKVTYNRRKYNFFCAHEYKQWLLDNDNPTHTCVYLKGLGSNDDEDIEDAFTSGRVREYVWDDDAEEMMGMAFDKEVEDERKDWVLSWMPDKGISSFANRFKENTVSYFVSSHLCEFAYTNTQRSIPSYVDSMKECNRKILYVGMKMKDVTAVTDFKGSVKTKTSYKYGDDSLYRAIVCMANVCVGTNNINLLQGKGQFDSRKGATAAKDRYIKAGPSKVLPYIIKNDDSVLLSPKYDEGKKIEPEHYYPIIPLFAINGVSGIATGFACSIPAHNPIDVMKWIIWWVKKHTGEEVSPNPPVLKPHYNNYQGRIYQKAKGWYSEGSYEEVPSRKNIKDIRVTELPITLTINAYINKLKGIIAKLPNKVLFKSISKSRKYTHKGQKRIEILPNILISGFVPQTDNVLKELGLIEKIPQSSIVLLDEKSRPKVYGSDLNAALSDFCLYRYNAYERRREALMKLWKEKIEELLLRKRYIEEVVVGSITFRTVGRAKTKAALLKDITNKGYPEKFLEMSMTMLTTDGLASVDRDIQSFQDKIDIYEKATAKSLWLEEIKELHTYLYK